MSGAASSGRNAENEATKSDKRAITLEMLQFIGHAIAKRGTGLSLSKVFGFL